MIVKNINNVSIVIPSRNDIKSLDKVLFAIKNQTILPNETVIVDSSENSEIKGLIDKYENIININYYSVKKAYPGKARNIGVNLSTSDWIAFLDCKTLPEKDWLERYQHLIRAYQTDLVFGVTQFDAFSDYQKVGGNVPPPTSQTKIYKKRK